MCVPVLDSDNAGTTCLMYLHPPSDYADKHSSETPVTGCPMSGFVFRAVTHMRGGQGHITGETVHGRCHGLRQVRHGPSTQGPDGGHVEGCWTLMDVALAVHPAAVATELAEVVCLGSL